MYVSGIKMLLTLHITDYTLFCLMIRSVMCFWSCGCYLYTLHFSKDALDSKTLLQMTSGCVFSKDSEEGLCKHFCLGSIDFYHHPLTKYTPCTMRSIIYSSNFGSCNGNTNNSGFLQEVAIESQHSACYCSVKIPLTKEKKRKKHR